MLQGALNRKDNQKLVSGFSHFYHNNLFLGILAIGYLFIVSTLSIPARLLLRKNMGERAFTIAAFFGSLFFFAFLQLIFFIFCTATAPNGLFERMNGTHGLNFSLMKWSNFFFNFFLFLLSPFTIFMVIIFSKGVTHFKYQLSRARENVIGYSFYRGDSVHLEHRKGGKIFGFKINELILRMIVEPLEVFKFSGLMLTLSILVFVFRGNFPTSEFLLLFIDDVTFGILAISVTILISSIALFLEEFAIMQKGRDAILDMIDGEFDMQEILSIKENLKVEAPKSLAEGAFNNNSLT